jgi:hypothetical protein
MAHGTVPNLMEELAAICAGRCICCERGLPHPDYSCCPHNERYAHAPIDNRCKMNQLEALLNTPSVGAAMGVAGRAIGSGV